jgi:hypothetical protein
MCYFHSPGTGTNTSTVCRLHRSAAALDGCKLTGRMSAGQACYVVCCGDRPRRLVGESSIGQLLSTRTLLHYAYVKRSPGITSLLGAPPTAFER